MIEWINNFALIDLVLRQRMAIIIQLNAIQRLCLNSKI